MPCSSSAPARSASRCVVSRLTPGAFYAAHLHAGTCLAPGAVALTLPDIYADEHGVAKLVTTAADRAAANYVATGFSVDVHAGPSASPTAVISCGDVTVKPAKSYAKAWLKGATAKGHAEAVQKGSDVTVWVKRQRPDAGRAWLASARRHVRRPRRGRRQPG